MSSIILSQKLNSVMQTAYQVKAVKNCRNYTKKCYLTYQDINEKLVEDLNEYGILEIIDFSSFAPLAKPCFKIKCFNALEISGVISGRELFVVIAKEQDHSLFDEIEGVISQWFQT